MTKTLLITLAALLIVPSAASAATATADIERRQGAPFGPVTFKAAEGEVNRVTVTTQNGRLRFHDDANRVTAKGDCEQVNAMTAICPFTEDIAEVRLGNRNDTAKAENLVEVLGGSGADLLRGSGGVDMLDGQAGDDTLRGAGDNDDLTGGTGRDDVAGGRGDDDLIDGETDRNAARDVYRGGSSRDSAGSDRGDQIFYTLRTRDLNVDLTRDKVVKGAENDDIAGIESVAAGSGNDKIAGDHDDNWLDGNGGADRIRARGGNDIPMGGRGHDTVRGEAGEDVVWGNGGNDSLSGGSGNDLMDGDDLDADTISCGTGDDDARVTAHDTLDDCEIAAQGSLYVRVQPEINGNEAIFRVACQRLGGCSGTLSMRGPDGEEFGAGQFTGLPDDPQTFSDVSVALSQAAVAALEQGVVVHVGFGLKGGYQTFMRAP